MMATTGSCAFTTGVCDTVRRASTTSRQKLNGMEDRGVEIQIQAMSYPDNLVVIAPHGPRRTRNSFVVLPSLEAAT